MAVFLLIALIGFAVCAVGFFTEEGAVNVFIGYPSAILIGMGLLKIVFGIAAKAAFMYSFIAVSLGATAAAIAMVVIIGAFSA